MLNGFEITLDANLEFFNFNKYLVCLSDADILKQSILPQ